jgi:hypothetical protein
MRRKYGLGEPSPEERREMGREALGMYQAGYRSRSDAPVWVWPVVIGVMFVVVMCGIVVTCWLGLRFGGPGAVRGPVFRPRIVPVEIVQHLQWPADGDTTTADASL